jgi:hypothetical protein
MRWIQAFTLFTRIAAAGFGPAPSTAWLAGTAMPGAMFTTQRPFRQHRPRPRRRCGGPAVDWHRRRRAGLPQGWQNHSRPAGHGFPSKNISALYMDKEGVLWVGTSGNGLIRFQSGHWINYTTDNGLNGNGVDYIIEDDARAVFGSAPTPDLMRVKKSDLNAFAAGALNFIPCHSYGERDGLPSDECTLGSQPAACRAADGTLWFPTIAGLVPIDPAQIQTRTNPLPVLIESVLIEGQDQGVNGPHGQPPQSVVVPAGKEVLEIRYTGLNLDDPQQIRFRYMMGGYETNSTNWYDAGQRRAVQYSKLPPGTYHFQVTARNEDGVWNPAAARLEVTVLPAFWQTPSFRAAVAAALLAGIIALVYFHFHPEIAARARRSPPAASPGKRPRPHRPRHPRPGRRQPHPTLPAGRNGGKRQGGPRRSRRPRRANLPDRPRNRARPGRNRLDRQPFQRHAGRIDQLYMQARAGISGGGRACVTGWKPPPNCPPPPFPPKPATMFSWPPRKRSPTLSSTPALPRPASACAWSRAALPWKSKTTDAAPPGSPARPPNPETACATCAKNGRHRRPI